MDMLRSNGAWQETMESVRRGDRSLGWEWFVEQEGFEPGMKQRWGDGWCQRWVSGGRWSGGCKKRWVGVSGWSVVVGVKPEADSGDEVRHTERNGQWSVRKMMWVFLLPAAKSEFAVWTVDCWILLTLLSSVLGIWTAAVSPTNSVISPQN